MRFRSSHRVLVPAAVVAVSLALGMVYGAGTGHRDGPGGAGGELTPRDRPCRTPPLVPATIPRQQMH